MKLVVSAVATSFGDATEVGRLFALSPVVASRLGGRTPNETRVGVGFVTPTNETLSGDAGSADIVESTAFLERGEVSKIIGSLSEYYFRCRSITGTGQWHYCFAQLGSSVVCDKFSQNKNTPKEQPKC